MAAVSRDQFVLSGNSVLDTNRNSLLACGQMAEASDFLFFVETIGRHFHASKKKYNKKSC
jgi:hypothetical protein